MAAGRLLPDARYYSQHAYPKWNIRPTVLQEHRLFPRVFPELTTADHWKIALNYGEQAKAMRTQWHEAVAAAEKKYGSHGTLIAAGLREYWPESAKEKVRYLGYGYSELFNAAEAHWKAAGRRSTPPWRGR
ncbi:MAG: hypothetical protein ACHREM_00125 [Polyangiales bacterium]